MSRLFKWTMLFAALLTLSFSLVSCEDKTEEPDGPENPETPDVPGNPVFILNENKVEVTADGGRFNVTYTLENPVQGQEIIPSAEVSWIKDFNVEKMNEISFSVEKNEKFSKRDAIVSVTYGSIRTKFNVLQAAAEVPEGGLFNLEVSGITETQFDVKATPVDMNMSYYVHVLTKEKYDTFKSNDELYDHMFSWLEFIGGVTGNTMEEMAREHSAVGIYDKHWDMHEADTDYVLFAYGLDIVDLGDGILEAKVTTDPDTLHFRTLAPEMIDMTFDLQITDVVSGSFTFSVIPSRDDQNYVYACILKNALDESGQTIEEHMQEWILGQLYSSYVNGLTWQEQLAQMVSKGPDSHTFEKVYNDKKVLGYAAAVDDEGYICSQVETIEFDTYHKENNQNQLSGEVTDITSNSCVLKVRTTNDDQYVVVRSKDDGRWDGKTEEEIMKDLTGFYSLDDLHCGDYDVKIPWLEPETDYRLFLFGWDNGVTTDYMLQFKFRTKPAKEDIGDVSFEFSVGNFTDHHMADVECRSTPGDACFLFGVASAKATQEDVLEQLNQSAYLMGLSWNDYINRTYNQGYKRASFELFPGQEYKAYAIAVNWDVLDVSGDMVFGEIFTDEGAVPSEYEVSVIWDKYFDLDALYEAGKIDDPYVVKNLVGDGRYAVLPTQTVINCDDPEIWFFDYTQMYDNIDGFSDADIAWSIRNFCAPTDAEGKCDFYLEYGKTYWMCALASELGYKYTELFKKKIIVTRDGISPVDEFPSLSGPAMSGIVEGEKRCLVQIAGR